MKKISFALLILVCFSCRTNELKEPVDLAVKIGVENKSSSASYIEFTEGFISLSSFTFNGQRTGADDVFFEQEWDTGSKISLSNSSISDNLKFQIPKGVYSLTTITFELFDDDEKSI